MANSDERREKEAMSGDTCAACLWHRVWRIHGVPDLGWCVLHCGTVDRRDTCPEMRPRTRPREVASAARKETRDVRDA